MSDKFQIAELSPFTFKVTESNPFTFLLTPGIWVDPNLVTTWQPSNDPFNIFTFSNADIIRAYRSSNTYAQRDTNNFLVRAGYTIIITANLTYTGAKPNFSLVVFNGFIYEDTVPIALESGDNVITYNVINNRTFYLNASTTAITDFALTLNIAKRRL